MIPVFRHAQAHPDVPALWTSKKRWTYGGLGSVIAKTIPQLSTHNIEKGTRVGLRLPNKATMIVLLWSLWQKGAVAVPISTRVPPEAAVRRAQQVGCTALITSGDQIDASSSDLTIFSPEAFVQREGAQQATTPAREGPDDRPATILFTSGSTGKPKAALHTWANHRFSAKGSNANLPVRRGDRWLLSLPLYHVGGLAILIRCALAGGAVALPRDETPLHESLRAMEATHVSLVATQLRRILEATRGAPPSSLRGVLLGGGPIPDALLRRGHDRGWPLLTSYGCTEMASQVTTTAPGAPQADLFTAGRRLPHRRLRVVDEEIQVAGAPLFQGYVTEDGIEAPLTDDGWYQTGDRGRIDASGRVHVRGRLDRMFVSGGENIQPEEVESTLERLGEVERAVVVPVPDEEYGQRPVAFVRLADGGAISDIEAQLRRSLPGFKIPDAFHSLPQSIETNGLKIDRSALRERARKLRDSGVGRGQ